MVKYFRNINKKLSNKIGKLLKTPRTWPNILSQTRSNFSSLHRRKFSTFWKNIHGPLRKILLRGLFLEYFLLAKRKISQFSSLSMIISRDISKCPGWFCTLRNFSIQCGSVFCKTYILNTKKLIQKNYIPHESSQKSKFLWKFPSMYCNFPPSSQFRKKNSLCLSINFRLCFEIARTSL